MRAAAGAFVVLGLAAIGLASPSARDVNVHAMSGVLAWSLYLVAGVSAFVLAISLIGAPRVLDERSAGVLAGRSAGVLAGRSAGKRSKAPPGRRGPAGERSVSLSVLASRLQ